MGVGDGVGVNVGSGVGVSVGVSLARKPGRGMDGASAGVLHATSASKPSKRRIFDFISPHYYAFVNPCQCRVIFFSCLSKIHKYFDNHRRWH
jgi:hypothetical protein